MMTMTWGEFKAWVDAALLAAGIDDSVEIQYIDVTLPEPTAEGNYRSPDVWFDENCGIKNMCITN